MTRARMTDPVMKITACRRAFGDDPGRLPPAAAHSVMIRARMTDSVMKITACRRAFGDDPGKNDRLSDEDHRLPPRIR